MINLQLICVFHYSSTNVVMNYTDVEAKVREATNDDPWGPTGQQKKFKKTILVTKEILCASFNYGFIHFAIVNCY